MNGSVVEGVAAGWLKWRADLIQSGLPTGNDGQGALALSFLATAVSSMSQLAHFPPVFSLRYNTHKHSTSLMIQSRKTQKAGRSVVAHVDQAWFRLDHHCKFVPADKNEYILTVDQAVH